MAESYSLSAATRTTRGRKAAKVTRDSKTIPAVLYGHGIETQSLTVNGLEFQRLFQAAGESSLVDLRVNDGEPVKVLIHSIQRDPIRDTTSHIDFYQVRMDEELSAEVELVFVGESPAVKDLGGTLVKNYSHLEIQCLPKDLPHDLQIDISTLRTFTDTIRVKDVQLPTGVTVVAEPEEVVAAVSAPRTEEELAALEQEVVEDVESVGDAEKPASDSTEAGADTKDKPKDGE